MTMVLTMLGITVVYAGDVKFKAVSAEGVEFSYKTLSQSTVEVTGGKVKGVERLIIPERVDYEGTSYIVKEIGQRAFVNTGILSLVVPASVTKIGNRAFWYCEKLEEVSLPEGLREIGECAFVNSALTTLAIPKSVKTIGDRAFAGFNMAFFAKDYDFTCIPSILTTSNSKSKGITSASIESYRADHPVNAQVQPQVVYVQAPAQQQAPLAEATHKVPSSDVDVNLPNNPATNENTFAVIIANENYQEEVTVEYALNDGEMFKEYCCKVLGIPEDNIHIRKDATRNNLIAEVAWMQKVAEAYKGEARFVVYYAGHGIPDEKSGSSYLLPVDGKGSMLETGYSLQQFYQQLGEMPSSGVVVFMDACFSGSKRGDGMLASARGVAIKAKVQEPKGKMVVFSAAQGDETAYPLKDKEHGLFTYYLLKKLKDTQGNVTLGELSSYVSDQVSKKSIVSNGKSQTPSVSHSSSMNESWKTMKLK